MTGVRNTGFVVSLALLASLVGHFAIQRHFERRAETLTLKSAADRPSPRTPGLSIVRHAEMELSDSQMPRFLGGHQTEQPLAPVHDVREKKNPPIQRASNPSGDVPIPADSSSAEPHAADPNDGADAVREVIEHELSNATREERDIWFDELKSLPAGVVRDLLQVRKQLRAFPKILGGIPEKLASADPEKLNRPREVPAEPASRKIRFNLPDHLASAAALELAASQLRHNVANASTTGFKRLRITLVDSYSPIESESANPSEPAAEPSIGSGIQAEGCRLAPTLLDLKQGTLRKTARQLDLAIDGDGFFVVRVADKEYLTRCGAFTLNREHQLCLAVARSDAVVQPVVTVPEGTRELQVAADGTISALKSDEPEAKVIGKLHVACVASPARLQPAGDSLFIANERSGNPVMGSALSNGAGEIHQGFLEQSNVDFEAELEQIEEFNRILNALAPHSPHPATASKPHGSPKQ